MVGCLTIEHYEEPARWERTVQMLLLAGYNEEGELIMSRRGQVIVFHYIILSDKKRLTVQKFYLGVGKDDMASARIMLDDSGCSESMGVISELSLLDRRLSLSAIIMKKDRFKKESVNEW